jgi:hypothetical protein
MASRRRSPPPPPQKEMHPLLRAAIVGIGRIGARGGAKFVSSVTHDVGEVVAGVRDKLKNVEFGLEEFYEAMTGQKRDDDERR